MDIIQIDAKIKQYFREEEQRLEEYREKIVDIELILSGENISDIIRKKLIDTHLEYKKRVQDIETEEAYGFYLIESLPILESYKNMLKTPIQLNFFGTKDVSRDVNNEKEELAYKFSLLAKKYIGDIFTENNTRAVKKRECYNCSSKKIILVDDLVYICVDCGCERDGNINTLSYKDMSRTNVLQKYTYEKRSHFKDALNQYQGKQNCKIDSKVFKDLEEQMERHHLLIGDANTARERRFSNINKNHIMLFLKELGYDKHYENANYIHTEITGKKCPDISHLEDQLIDDFDTLANLYTKKYKYEKNIDRKSFINIQCVFFQLLKKNKYPCKKEDFNMLKTTERKTFHDDILQELFGELGWNYTPFF